MPWIMKAGDCTQKTPQGPEQILAVKHRGRECLTVITQSNKIMGDFRDGEGKPRKEEVTARLGKEQTLTQLRDFNKEMVVA